MSTTYAFRDSDLAAQRLALVAHVFEPTTRAFLGYAPQGVELVVDLGCGTGYTTRLLDEVLAPERTVGLDNSRAFVDRARRRGVEAIEHDVTAMPLPTGAADVLFCRFVLSHLPDPATTLNAWATQLAPGGVLLVEEVDAIETDDPAFARYLATVREVLGRRGATLEVGSALVVHGPSHIAEVRPDPVAVVRMFRLNLEAWRDEIDALLAEELDRGLGEPSRGPIVWRLRQLVVEAAA